MTSVVYNRILLILFAASLATISLIIDPARAQQELDQLNELNRRIEDLYRAERYQEAIPLASMAVTLSEQALGPKHSQVARAMHSLAELYSATRQYLHAEPLYQRALAIWEQTLGTDHIQITVVLGNLATLYRDMRRYSEAEPLYQRRVAIWEKAVAQNDRYLPYLAQALDDVARLYTIVGQYAHAELLYEREQAIWEKIHGPDHLYVAAVLNSLGAVYYAMGKYEQAESSLLRALAIQETTLGPDSPQLARTLTNLAALYTDIFQNVKAESLLLRALAIRERNDNVDSPERAHTLSNLAGLHATTGRYPQAEAEWKRAVSILEKALGPDHVDTGRALGNLAQLYYKTRQYALSEQLQLRALAIWEKAMGPDHPEVAAQLSNLAVLYLDLRQYGRAEPFLLRVLAIREKSLGPNHPDVALALNNLAMLYGAIGQYQQTEAVLQQALSIWEKAMGPSHPRVALALNNLAGLYDEVEAFALAEPLFLKALTIREQAFGPDHPDVAEVLHNLAGFYYRAQQYAPAKSSVLRALNIREKTFGYDHPIVGDSLIMLAGLEAVQRQFSTALSGCRQGLKFQEEEIKNVFAITSELQKLQYVLSIEGAYLKCISLIHQYLWGNELSAKVGLEMIFQRKGIVLDSQSHVQKAVLNQLSEADRHQWDLRNVLRSDQARLSRDKPEKMSPQVYRQTISVLRKQIEDIEKRLVSENVVAKAFLQRDITVEEIAKTLPGKSALLEFISVRDFDFKKGRFSASERYLVFILTASGIIKAVDLGDALAIELAAAHMLRNLRRFVPRDPITSEEAYRSLKEFYSKVWAPLEKFLGNTDKVLISPDGALSLVPFAALMDSEGHHLLERYQIAYVTSGRELVGSMQGTVKPETDLLLVAHPAYDLEIQKTATPVASSPPLRSREVGGALKFRPLQGTAREARDIPPLVSGPDERKRTLLDVNATEAAVKMARSPRVLHLATHGFFLQDNELSLDGSKRGTVRQYENPLVRSGLALAGANHAAEITEGEDGLLTALEVSGLDLHDTELVVLSACETGVGDVQNGEGVFGLRRAFALAGAKNLLMSLWKVDDVVTAEQMRTFYEYFPKMSPAEALRQAQLKTIQELKAMYNGLAPPKLWAPFILQGAHALGP